MLETERGMRAPSSGQTKACAWPIVFMLEFVLESMLEFVLELVVVAVCDGFGMPPARDSSRRAPIRAKVAQSAYRASRPIRINQPGLRDAKLECRARHHRPRQKPSTPDPKFVPCRENLEAV